MSTFKRKYLPPLAMLLAILLVWELLVRLGVLSAYLFPSPTMIVAAIPAALPRIGQCLPYTLCISAVGYVLSLAIALAAALLMDVYPPFAHALRPLLVLIQSVPIITLAPLFVLWLGFGMAPKILTIILVCSFPMIMGLDEGLRSTDPARLALMRTMRAGPLQTFLHLKLPSSLPALFSGLKIAGTYCIMGAVIGEWLGGDGGIGTLMIQYKNSYAYSKMFVIVILICLLSMGVYLLMSLLQYVVTHRWKMDKSTKM